MYLSTRYLHIIRVYPVYCAEWCGVSRAIYDSRFHPERVLELLLSFVALQTQCSALAVSLLGKAAQEPIRLAFGFLVI